MQSIRRSNNTTSRVLNWEWSYQQDTQTKEGLSNIFNRQKLKCGNLKFVNAAAKSPKRTLILNNGLLTSSNLDRCSVIFPIKKLLNAEILSPAPQMLMETNIKFNSDLTLFHNVDFLLLIISSDNMHKKNILEFGMG